MSYVKEKKYGGDGEEIIYKRVHSKESSEKESDEPIAC